MGFTEGTTVRRVDDGRFSAEIAADWDIMGNANGGYLLALAARAIGEATDNPDPVTITGHYLAPGRPGPAEISVDVARKGSRHATASARVLVEGRPILVVLATTTDLTRAEGPMLVDASPPDLPPPDDCIGSGQRPDGPNFMHRVDLRLHPDDSPFGRGPSGVARMRGWFRLAGGEPIDTLSLVLASDAFPPTIFNAGLPVGWAPTVELTTHIRARPAPGWLRCAFTTRFIQGGYLEEDGEIWDETGALVAQSRQLALVPRT